MNYSDESLEAEQMSNSKSEDTQELANTVANLKVDGERANLYRPTIEPPQDTPDPSKVDELTDKLRKLLNKDGVWSSEYNSVLLEIEESATPEPPQDATIHDVVNGTPKGQEAVQKAIDNSIKVQNEMTKKAQDTSLDDILAILDDHHSIVTDELGKSCAKELLAWHKAEIAKINHLIVLAKLEGFDIAFDCHDYDRLRAYKEQLTKELGDSEAEKNSGTWSRV